MDNKIPILATFCQHTKLGRERDQLFPLRVTDDSVESRNIISGIAGEFRSWSMLAISAAKRRRRHLGRKWTRRDLIKLECKRPLEMANAMAWGCYHSFPFSILLFRSTVREAKMFLGKVLPQQSNFECILNTNIWAEWFVWETVWRMVNINKQSVSQRWRNNKPFTTVFYLHQFKFNEQKNWR